MVRLSVTSLLWLLVATRSVQSFVLVRPTVETKVGIRDQSNARTPYPILFVARRYGPPSEASYPTNSNNGSDNKEDQERQLYKLETAQRKLEFRNLIESCLATRNPEHLPQLFGKHIELIMSLHGEEGAQVVEEIIEEAKQESDELYKQTVELVDSLLTFSQDFAEQVLAMDDHNKKLLGKIIRAMTGTVEGQITEGVEENDAMSSSKLSDREREDALDQLMQVERENFTPGFLRHIEGECHRIESAPMMTRESAKLLEILRMIQTRVLEEVGKDMGETAVVLGQLMGYDDENELIGVLEAGLTVRGLEFAQEMKELTEEALDGFKRVPGGHVEEELVERVTLVDNRLQSYLEENGAFQ